MKDRNRVANMSDGCGAPVPAIGETRSLSRRRRPKSEAEASLSESVWVRTAVLRNRLGYTARVAVPDFPPAGFAQVDDLGLFEALVIETCVIRARIFGGPQSRLEEGFCFVPRHRLVTFGMHQDQIKPRTGS
jgi:hypothetical protein